MQKHSKFCIFNWQNWTTVRFPLDRYSRSKEIVMTLIVYLILYTPISTRKALFYILFCWFWAKKSQIQNDCFAFRTKAGWPLWRHFSYVKNEPLLRNVDTMILKYSQGWHIQCFILYEGNEYQSITTPHLFQSNNHS